jgi:hypothetical protein
MFCINDLREYNAKLHKAYHVTKFEIVRSSDDRKLFFVLWIQPKDSSTRSINLWT